MGFQIKGVKSNVEEGSGIARACGLGDFDVVSIFLAGDRFVDYAGDSLRGVPKVGEADEQKIKDFYALLEDNPATHNLAKDMLNEKTAPIVLQMASSYFTQAKEQ